MGGCDRFEMVIFSQASKIYVVDLGGRKLSSFFWNKKKAGNLDKVPFYVELGDGVLHPAKKLNI